MLYVCTVLCCFGSITSSYHIGNSFTHRPLTNDGAITESPFAITDTVGGHINFGSALSQIRQQLPPEIPPVYPNPPSGTYGAFGPYVESMNNFDWDAVVLQPFGTIGGSTLDTDVDFFKEIETLESGATLVLMAAWPGISGSTFDARWNSGVGAGSNPATIMTEAYFDLLQTTLSTELSPGTDLKVAPIGYVFDAINNTGIPGLTSVHDLYSVDELHLNQTGNWVAYATLYTVLHHQLPDPNSDMPFSSMLTSAGEAAILAEIASVTAIPEPAAWLLGVLVVSLVASTSFMRKRKARRQ